MRGVCVRLLRRASVKADLLLLRGGGGVPPGNGHDSEIGQTADLDFFSNDRPQTLK